jgi:flavin reductase (DIM6/NTAB) family NADH-FMN oxidoreductase RutF
VTGVDHVLAELAPRDRYKLLSSLVIPRPIALVTSLSSEGVLNAAPFSFFNVFSHQPALVVLGVERRARRQPKDTARNAVETRELVVNLVDEALAEAMNVCAVDFPPEESEIDAAGLSLVPSLKVKPPRIAEAPAALECRLFVTLDPGHGRQLILGEVLAIHTREALVDPTTLHLDLDAYRPIGRLFANLYCRTRDQCELVRQTHAEWLAEQDGRG